MTLTPEQIQRLQVEDGLISEDSPQGASDRALRGELRLCLMPGHVPSLMAGVMEAVGGTPLHLGDAIRESAGRPPGLWAPVAEAIDAPVSGLGEALREALVTEANGGPAGASPSVRRSRWPWFTGLGFAAAAAAAAAAALLFFGLQSPSQVIEPVAGVLAPVVRVAKAVVPAVPAALDLPGITIIESLESETASVLQVLQFDVESPTIIFIDDDPGD